MGLEPPVQITTQRVTASNSVVVQTAGGDAHVQVNQAPPPVIRWVAMTAPEAARKLESMLLPDAVEALADMEPALAARRLSHVRPDWAQQLLSHMDEGLAADLLSTMTASGQAAALLAGMEPSQAAAILDMTVADWTVARLAEMDPDRALVLLAAMGSKRTDNLLAAMERQQTVRLLGAVSKVLTDQARARTTFDLAQREAERIAAQARREAKEALDRARAEADAIRSAARREQVELRTVGPPDPISQVTAALRSPLPSADRSADQPDHAADQLAGRSVGLHPNGSDGRARGAVNGRHVPGPSVSGAHRAGPRRLAAGAAPSTTFPLPGEYFLIAHDSSGRPRIDQSTLETGLAGALLCELVRTAQVTVDDGLITAAANPSCVDPVGEYALRTLFETPRTPVKSWVREHRKVLFVRLAQELADAGVVVPVTRSWPRSGVAYKPADEALANGPAVRLVRFLLDASVPPDEATYLLGALVDTTGLHRVLPIGVRPRQVRELLSRLLVERSVSAPLRAVLDGINAAVASIVLSPRGR